MKTKRRGYLFSVSALSENHEGPICACGQQAIAAACWKLKGKRRKRGVGYIMYALCEDCAKAISESKIFEEPKR